MNWVEDFLEFKTSHKKSKVYFKGILMYSMCGLKWIWWKQNLFEPDTTVDAHEADLEVAVSEVGEVEVDRDRLCLLTVRSLVGRHVRDRRWNGPEVGPLKSEISLSVKVSL
jgi:hypothetical protein